MKAIGEKKKAETELLEVKHTICKMKSTLIRNDRLDITEEKINKDIIIEKIWNTDNFFLNKAMRPLQVPQTK